MPKDPNCPDCPRIYRKEHLQTLLHEIVDMIINGSIDRENEKYIRSLIERL